MTQSTKTCWIILINFNGVHFPVCLNFWKIKETMLANEKCDWWAHLKVHTYIAIGKINIFIVNYDHDDHEQLLLLSDYQIKIAFNI